jgi:cation diffusion facilitator CzcD-associated flavoprotein CzcO
MLDWLIIGGGIHGTHLSLYLTQRRGVPPDCIRVLDPHDEPLALWRHFTSNTGMEFLRSPGAHHLHYDPFALATFARAQSNQHLARFIEPYGRPALALFNAYSERLIERYRLCALRLTGRANGLIRLRDGWRIETAQGGVEARRVVLCIGNEQPHWPEWAAVLRDNAAPIYHIFDPHFSREALPPGIRVVVIGGGITAVQTALTLSGTRQVTLLMRHAPRVHSFDADTGWITPQYLDGFHREADYSRRRALIAAARHRGSMPPDVARELERAQTVGMITAQIGAVQTAELQANPSRSTITLYLTDGTVLSVHAIVLATGFEQLRPGGTWLDAAIHAHGLPTAPDGFPLVDAALRWADGVFVTGPLAELEVGPVSRNFIGARLAAERIGAHT